MDKNLFLAVALSLGVYAVWFGFIEKRFMPVKPVSSAQPAASPAAQIAKATPAQVSKGAGEDEIKDILAQAQAIELGRSRVLINPRGAAAVSWHLHGTHRPVEMVHDPHAGLLSTFPELSFARVASSLVPAFTATRADGLSVLKEFLPEGEGALPRLRITVYNAAAKPLELAPWTLSLGPGLGTIPSEAEENPKLWRAVGLHPGKGGLHGKIEVFKAGTHTGPFRWVGVDNRYFLAAVLPPEGFAIESALPPRIQITAPAATLAAGQKLSWEIPYYVGAKGQTWLAHYGVGLERSIDFGFFAQIGRWTLQVLAFLHDKTGNWGWSIILLTVLLQILLFPLTYKSLKAAAAMKKLQPEMTRLQQKYANDPAKLNAEMMDLYKRSGANPLGGCLPMLLQMPVFIALFNALRNAWELHDAPWILWIKDLSVKDPYYVLPLVMGALMFVQNKMNPPTADPTQAKMMTWMPVIFTFMFLNFPSGLVLYWLTSSVLSFIQQMALKGRLA